MRPALRRYAGCSRLQQVACVLHEACMQGACISSVNPALRVAAWMEKHAVDEISVVVDMREFKDMGGLDSNFASCNWIQFV